MNKSNIEFCDYTWNPIVGCRIGCRYCWAKRFHHRFYPGQDFTDPTFFPTRLTEPSRVITPLKIFVCSMGDIFSPGVQTEWIEQVINVAKKNSRHTFQFLTKRPQDFANFYFPPNVWLGTSIEDSSSTASFMRIKHLTNCGCKFTKFLLIEPLLGPVTTHIEDIDFVFVGAMTGPGAVVPEKRWIESIKHPNIVWKENIKKYL